MTKFAYPMRFRAPVGRSLAFAALLGATMLAAPLTAVRAGTVGNAAFQLAQAAPKTEAGAAATATRGESLEQRITTLHAALKITPEETANWNAVAQTMRENSANMDKLIAESRATAPRGMSAVDDLQLYQKFAEAHVDGLKNLIGSFSALYSAMPDAQKKIADGVFAAARETAGAHS